MTSKITLYVTHRLFNTDLLYSYAHFIVEIDENIALVAGFNTI